ncbi:MAG: hypothetical protein MK077_07985 [Phycisphaerales bacterium]|nr:hypothetical protein [Phycisphaerales bacterium]
MPLASLILIAAQSTSATVSLSPPTFDRWMYPYNITPGTRAAAPTFSGYGSGSIDNRYGQTLYGWGTEDSIDSGWAASNYTVTSCTVRIAVLDDDIIYDPTPDDPASHEIDGPADEDPGRPTLLSAVDFRNKYDGWSFGEDGPYGVPGVGTRNCFAADLNDQGQLRDISNSLTDGFIPNSFAFGQSDLVEPGEAIPQFSEVIFEVDVNDPDIQCYLRTGLANGLLEFMITSLHGGSQDGSGSYPNWIMKENTLVDLGAVSAATLIIEATINEPSGNPGDVDGDGTVGIEDLLLLLADFGRCPCCVTDIDGNGIVEVDDLLSLISYWGQ